MKKIILVLLILLFSSSAFASPFLVSDPSAQAIGGKFTIKENGVTILTADNQSDGSVRADLANVIVGTHSYQIAYIVTDPVWGTQTSAYVPFTFTRPPLASGSIQGLKLVP